MPLRVCPVRFRELRRFCLQASGGLLAHRSHGAAHALIGLPRNAPEQRRKAVCWSGKISNRVVEPMTRPQTFLQGSSFFLAACALLLSANPARAQIDRYEPAETMVTSYYRAKAPHIAAHRTLPIGTRLLVTNPRNGRSARVVIGDRGPFLPGRSLDVSHAIAKRLGFEKSGVLRLQTRLISR